MVRTSSVLALILVGITLLGNSACADDKRSSREREALRRVQQQMQQMAQEKAALEQKVSGFEQEKSALSGEKDALAKKAQGAESRVAVETRKRQRLEQELETARKENQSLLEQKAEVEKRLLEMTATQTDSARQLAVLQGEKKQNEASLATREKQIAVCEDSNLKLYQYGRDLIKQCRDHSATDAVLRLEPVTGIKRVEIENLLEEYRDKLDAQKLIPDEQQK